jgi:hypothetical protein
LQIKCGGLSGLFGRDILLGIEHVDYLIYVINKKYHKTAFALPPSPHTHPMELLNPLP